MLDHMDMTQSIMSYETSIKTQASWGGGAAYHNHIRRGRAPEYMDAYVESLTVDVDAQVSLPLRV